MKKYCYNPKLLINYTYFEHYLPTLSYRIHNDICYIDHTTYELPVDIKTFPVQPKGFGNFEWPRAKEIRMYAYVTFFDFHDKVTSCIFLTFPDLLEFQATVQGITKIKGKLLVDLYNKETHVLVDSYLFNRAIVINNYFKKQKNIKK